MVFNVTQEHIDKGKPESADACPVALCLKSAISDIKFMEVTAGGIYFKRGDDEADFFAEAPDAVTDFVDRFDARYQVEPFSFELPL